MFKHLAGALLVALFLLGAAPGAHAQQEVKICTPVTNTVNGATQTYCWDVSGTNPLPVTGALTTSGPTPAGTNTIGGVFAVGSTTGGIVPSVSAATEGSHVCKTGAGTFYSALLNVHGTSGYLEIWDASSAPSDGAVNPIAPGTGGLLANIFVNVTNTSFSATLLPGPGFKFTNGLVLVFSSGSYNLQTTSASVEFTCVVQ